ncbi:pyridoxal phosphate-dependent transferase [Phycomyces nitens]|nr:pyridoxal phosphate-dependent transferase [Phycomyces nitens]
MSKSTAFGKHLRADFFLEEDYTPLNHGSYGSSPRFLHPVLHEYQLRSEQHPDRWLRREMFPVLDKNKEILSRLINCDPKDIVFVTNASNAVNSIMRSLPFEEGDKILCFNTAYNAVGKTIDYIRDSRKVDLVKVELAYPLSDVQVVQTIKDVIARQSNPERIRLCVMDGISSVPGVVFPFEQVVKLMKEHRILSLVDGAHCIGQIPLDIRRADPDFFLSNCHKWFFVPRSCAILYVSERLQRLVHPVIINADYQDHSDISDTTSTFQREFGWPGTCDFSSYMCIEKALEYRASLGGEEAIMSYCNNLAKQGGELTARVLGTCVMENAKGSLTAAMVNVKLPLHNPRLEATEIPNYFIDKLIYEHKCMGAVYRHNGDWWVRLSAQVYNELDEFEVIGKALLKVCASLEKNKL